MNSFGVAASMLAAVAAPPGESGKFNPSPALSSEAKALPLERAGFSRPVINYIAPDGSFRVKNGIIAGVQVAPRALVGIGFFGSAKRRRGSGDAALPEKRSKRAALGITLQF